MNFITYTHKGSEIKLSLPARRVVELEMKIEAPINEKIKEFDKLTTICDFMASAIEDGSYAERSEMALDIYDEMVSQGKNLQDYQLLIVDDLKLACSMAQSANVKIAFAGWSKTDLPELAAEMEQLCDLSFYDPMEFAKFLFD